MGENTNLYWYSNYAGGWNLSTIATNDVYTVGTTLDSRLDKMRGNNDDFIWFLDKNFDYFIDNIDKEEIEGGVKRKLEYEGDFILNETFFEFLVKTKIEDNEKNIE